MCTDLDEPLDGSMRLASSGQGLQGEEHAQIYTEIGTQECSSGFGKVKPAGIDEASKKEWANPGPGVRGELSPGRATAT